MQSHSCPGNEYGFPLVKVWVVYIIKHVKSGLYNLYPSSPPPLLKRKAWKEVEKPHNSEEAHLPPSEQQRVNTIMKLQAKLSRNIIIKA